MRPAAARRPAWWRGRRRPGKMKPMVRRRLPTGIQTFRELRKEKTRTLTAFEAATPDPA